MRREDFPGSCATCGYFLEQDGQAHGLCIANPPQGSALERVVIRGAPPQLSVMPFWPPVQPAHVCGKFAPAFETVKLELPN